MAEKKCENCIHDAICPTWNYDTDNFSERNAINCRNYLPTADVAEVAKEGSINYKYLVDWYQNSIDNETPPVWTDEHLKELLNDFYVVPKRED